MKYIQIHLTCDYSHFVNFLAIIAVLSKESNIVRHIITSCWIKHIYIYIFGWLGMYSSKNDAYWVLKYVCIIIPYEQTIARLLLIFRIVAGSSQSNSASSDVQRAHGEVVLAVLLISTASLFGSIFSLTWMLNGQEDFGGREISSGLSLPLLMRWEANPFIIFRETQLQ